MPVEPGTPDDCDTSAQPIVLVGRATHTAPRSIELRLRAWNDGRFPLPFTVTIPVSFERSRRWCVSLGASTVRRASEARHHRSTAGMHRKSLIHHWLRGAVM
jgi:hypothetical protein